MVNATTTEMDTPLGHVMVDYSYTITHSDEDASTPDIIEVTQGNAITETATASISYSGPITISGLSVHTEMILEGGGKIIASKSEDHAVKDITSGSSFSDSGTVSLTVPENTPPGQYYLTASAYTQLPIVGKKGETDRYLVKVISKNPTPNPSGTGTPTATQPTPIPTPAPKAEDTVVANTSIDTGSISNATDYVRQSSDTSGGSGSVNHTIDDNGLKVTVTGDVVSSGGGQTVMNNTTVTVQGDNKTVVTQGNYVIDDNSHTAVIDNMTMRIETKNETGAQAVVTIQGDATQQADGTTVIDDPVIVIEPNASTAVTVRGDTATVSSDGHTTINNATLQTGVLQGNTPDLQDIGAAITLNVNSLQGTPQLKMTITPEATSDVQTSFSLAALGDGTGIVNTAYVLTVEKSGLANGENSGSNGITSARITMKVPRAWVEANGGISKIKVFRYDAPSHTTESLDTLFVGSEFRFNDNVIVPMSEVPEGSELRNYGHATDAMLFQFDNGVVLPLSMVPDSSLLRQHGTEIMTFEAISPHGLSVFALASVATLSAPMTSTGSSDSGIMSMLPMAGSILMANPAYLGAVLVVLALVIVSIALVARSVSRRRKSKGNK